MNTELLERTIHELEDKVSDPFAADDELTEANRLLEEAKAELARALAYSPSVGRGEQAVQDKDGKNYVVNNFGYAEPDVATETPGVATYTPAEVEGIWRGSEYLEIIEYSRPLGISHADLFAWWGPILHTAGNDYCVAATMLREKVDFVASQRAVATKDDYDKIVLEAVSLGFIAAEVGTMWGELHKHGFGTGYTKGGLFALQCMVERDFALRELNRLANEGGIALKKLVELRVKSEEKITKKRKK